MNEEISQNDCCAIKTAATNIVTGNIKDFPRDYVASFGIKLSNPDDFVNDLIQAYPDIARFAFETMVSRLKTPPITREDVLAMLKRCGLPKTTQILTSRNQRL